MVIDDAPLFDLFQRAIAAETSVVIVEAAIAYAGRSSGAFSITHLRRAQLRGFQFDHTGEGKSGASITRIVIPVNNINVYTWGPGRSDPDRRHKAQCFLPGCHGYAVPARAIADSHGGERPRGPLIYRPYECLRSKCCTGRSLEAILVGGIRLIIPLE
jgi:hypothetical protein